MSNSERLRRKTDLLAPALAAPGRLLLQHPHARQLIPRYLTVSYDIGRTNIALLEAALECARRLAPRDPVAGPLVDYLEPHIAEEMHGDEPGDGALADLGALGMDAATLRESRPSAPVAALIGGQYFLALQYHPVAVLGFLQLEHYHPRRAAVERLIQATGLPREGFGQMLLHAEVDVTHSRELDAILDSLPLTQEQEQLIGVRALETMRHVSQALLDIVEGARKGTATKSENEVALYQQLSRPRVAARFGREAF